MNNRQWIDFELLAMDMAEADEVEDARELQEFTDSLYQHIAMATQDFADYGGFEYDFEPIY